MKEEVKQWSIKNYQTPAMRILAADGMRFSYDPEDGVVFEAPESYAEQLRKDFRDLYADVNDDELIIKEFGPEKD